MKNFVMKASFIPRLNSFQCTMPTAAYENWLREEGQIFAALSEKVVHNGAVTTITLSEPWFDICRRYCKILLTNAQTHGSSGAVLSSGSECFNAA